MDAGLTIPAAVRGSGPVHIVAVMVEFEPDDNRFTTGDGTFFLDYLDSPDIIIDPLPHNRGYFEAHLEFVRNYFETVSAGALEITYEVLPEIIRLDNEMKEYAPLGEDNSENFRLANLYTDTWTAVRVQLNPDFSGYDPDRTAFVIFHAGAGRDIELTGTTLDKTPQDIPSVYLDLEALSRLLGDSGFQGVTMGGGFRITNSAILPQTQSRPGEDVTGSPFVVQLSINGILTGTIGSFLGLPDLFNTITGASGIGRFGLMDGEAFFSLGGLFPPEPSAWEKIYMGWAEPVDVDLNDTGIIELPAAVLRQPGSIARHRISSDEYFLVENRHRDPSENGIEITLRRPDGSFLTRTITNADSLESKVLNSISRPERLQQILPPGVITRVSNFDWALPGGLTQDEDENPRLLNGGMLIWHIDEAVIRSKVTENRINANTDRRGVRVVEADGAQDIGRRSLTFTDYGRGSAFDFWWEGNDFTVITQPGERITVYENRFADDTQPNNRSNSGSPTFFEFYDFSDNVPVASFRARRAAAEWFDQVDTGPYAQLGLPSVNRVDYYRTYPLALSFYRNEPGDPLQLLIPSETGVIALRADVSGFSSLHQFDVPWPAQPLSGSSLVITGSPDAPVQGPTKAFTYSAGSWAEVWQNNDVRFTQGLISSERGDTVEFDHTRNRLLMTDGTALPALQKPRQRGKLIDGFRPLIDGNELILSDGTIIAPVWAPVTSPGVRFYTGTINPQVNATSFFLITEDLLILFKRDPIGDPVIIRTDGSISWPVFLDADSDGSLDVLYVDYGRNRLEARNMNGGSLWYFPLELSEGRRIAGPPLVADLTGNELPDFVIPVQDSLSLSLYAYDHEMKPLPGFPLYVGSVTAIDHMPVHPLIVDNMLIAVSHTGDLKAWTFPGMGQIWWGGHYGNEPYNKVAGRLESEGQAQLPFGLLNTDETYNWPNPADKHTHIRYQTSRSARIEISVITYSGDTFYKKNLETAGGLPEDHYIDTSSWGNGVYFARVTARSEGTTETRTFKIGVMH
ncbi:MAG: hypothetical protein ACNA8K_11510 [Cyclonatronaceae bacterium]